MDLLTTGQFLEKMLKVSPVDIADFFKQEKITFLKEIKMSIMRNALRAYVVKTRQECLTLDSRKNYRLLWFNVLSEFQLELLLDEVQDNEAIQTDYIKKLYLKILIQLKLTTMDTLKKFVEYLDTKEQMPEGTIIVARDVNTAFRDIFIEADGEFEGISLDKFRAIIHNSATQENINALGEKYGIKVPEKFSGDLVRDYVIQKLKNRHQLTDELKEKIETSKIAEVRQIAVENGVKNVISLNKKESIEYVLERVLPDYEEPKSNAVYEMPIPINPDEEKYSTLLLQYEQVGDEIQELQNAITGLSGLDKEQAEIKLREKELELAETKEKLNEITDKLSVLELRSGEELNNDIYGQFDNQAAVKGYDDLPEVVEKVEKDVRAVYIVDSEGNRLPISTEGLQFSLMNQFGDSNQPQQGYSIFVLVLYLLAVMGIGVGFFLILYATIY